MKYIKKFGRFIGEGRELEESPVITPITKPTRPVKPTPVENPDKDGDKIERPSESPEPKAATEMDVANRFIKEVNAKGESVKKYMK